ncbi:MAG: Hsp70 family protein [Caldilineaceae bacterium]|nr:Hsp70 family protein [Caldilineaceae bacterium]
MTQSPYIIGIDLGTTHNVLAYTRADPPQGQTPEIELLEIPQLVAMGEIEAMNLLPSFLFLPEAHDVAQGGLALPWDADIDYAVGEFARNRGAELPARLVASAKSWLGNTGVDRTAPILPWDAPAETRKVSPLEAMTRYLRHLRDAWNYMLADDDPAARLEVQTIYLTVPASFDAMARELTVQAAQSAGLTNFTLLEEPQAAFYAWLAAQDDWRGQIGVGESVLVCDVGGGTTDFSLIQVMEEEGNLGLARVAVGDHILLGGDNMDLTLAYAVRAKLAQQGTQLDNWQFRSLGHSCRQAKEKLLGNPELDAEPLVILGRGSSLIGGTIRTELTRSEIENILLQGFFPAVARTDYPTKKPQVGVREMGLPYAADPAVTRHLAYFLGRQLNEQEGDETVAFPSAVLFNGGVMKADAMQQAVLDSLRRWGDNPTLRKLPSVDLDLAVALGAAYYGLARKGQGIRIRAGTARSYYIGIESSMPAVPGVPTPIKALCVAPFGTEEGSDAQIIDKEFGLMVGEPALFQLLASTTRKHDRLGQEVEDWRGEIDEVATLEADLPASEAQQGGVLIPVLLQSRVNEVGSLELWCVARDDDRRWKLEFNLREGER